MQHTTASAALICPDPRLNQNLTALHLKIYEISHFTEKAFLFFFLFFWLVYCLTPTDAGKGNKSVLSNIAFQTCFVFSSRCLKSS